MSIVNILHKTESVNEKIQDPYLVDGFVPMRFKPQNKPAYWQYFSIHSIKSFYEYLDNDKSPYNNKYVAVVLYDSEEPLYTNMSLEEYVSIINYDNTKEIDFIPEVGELSDSYVDDHK